MSGYHEVIVVGESVAVADFEKHLKGLQRYVVESASNRLVLVVSPDEMRNTGILNLFPHEQRPIAGASKMYIFLQDKDAHIANSFNR